MTYSAEKPDRRSTRLEDFDYSQEGAYFITICVQGRQSLLGNIKQGTILLTHLGHIVKSEWFRLPQRFNNLALDEFVVMPNHIHGIIIINRRDESCIRPDYSIADHGEGDHKDRPYGTESNSIGRIIQAYKSITTNKYISCGKKNNWKPVIRRLW
jgi:hypothetical protein